MNNALFYLHNPPFDVLTDSERTQLAKHSKLLYLDKDKTLQGEADDLFIVIKGKLTQWQDGELIGGLHENDWFFLTDRQGQILDTKTYEQSLLFCLMGTVIKAVSASNTLLNAQLFANLQQKARHLAKQNTTTQQELLSLPIKALGNHIKNAKHIGSQQTLMEAAKAMHASGFKHLLIKDETTLGIITQTDLCRAVALGADMHTPVKEFGNFFLYSIDEEQELSEALMLMLEHKIHRLPVTKEGQIVGVLGQSELLNFIANHSELLLWRIENAQSLDQLAYAIGLIDAFVQNQIQTGTKTHLLARTVQNLNTHIFAKVWQLIAPPAVIANTCVVVMGSEGRGEQILRTDQDNALIVKDGFCHPNLAQIAQAFNDDLHRLGYPYCTGNVMMGSTLWRQSLSGFKTQITSWLFAPNPEDFVNFATWVDAKAVAGDDTLLQELKSHSRQTLSNAAPNFLNRFALPVVQVGSHAGFWLRFTGGKDSGVDLKKAGIFPIVHGTRTLAIEYNIDTTNTRERLMALEKMGVLEREFSQNLIEALAFFMAKRLSAFDLDDKRVNINRLSALERDLLKESLSLVKAFKAFITHHYRLDIFGAS